MIASRVLIVLLGLGCLAFGSFALIDPEGVAGWAHLVALDGFARSELRASYGGLWFAMGVLLVGSRGSGASVTRVRTIGWCWAGRPAARLLGLWLETGSSGPDALFLAIEILMLALIYLA